MLSVCAVRWKPGFAAARGERAGRGTWAGFVSQRLSNLLASAEREAGRLKDEYVSVEHLVIALLKEGSATAAGRLLDGEGLTRDQFLRELTAIRGNQRVTSAMPEGLRGAGEIPQRPGRRRHPRRRHHPRQRPRRRDHRHLRQPGNPPPGAARQPTAAHPSADADRPGDRAANPAPGPHREHPAGNLKSRCMCPLRPQEPGARSRRGQPTLRQLRHAAPMDHRRDRRRLHRDRRKCRHTRRGRPVGHLVRVACRKISPALEQVATQLAGHLKLVKVDVDRAPRLSQRFAVHAVPTPLLINHGQIISRQTGAAPAPAICTRVEEAITGTAPKT